MFAYIKRLLNRLFHKKQEQPKKPTAQSPIIPAVIEHPVISTQPKPATQIQSRRLEDMSSESELARFLDLYLYGHFPKAGAFNSIERAYSKKQQLSGIDVVFKAKDGRTFYVDEKAQLYYLNKDLPTFAFEIEFLRNGIPTTGWLCNDGLETDLYLLVWPFATHDDPKGIRTEDFTKADCLLVQKTDVLKFLNAYGLSVDKLMRDAKQIRKEGKTKKIPIPGVSGIYYYASDPKHYREAPINVVISKHHLMRIKQRRYIVTPEKVEME